jgi:hypothetical protein
MNLRRSLNWSFAVLLLFALAFTARAAFPEAELKRVVSITLTTELLEKMEKFVTSVKSDAGAKAELAAATKEDKDNGLRGEAWGKLITAKCPKTVALFEAAGVTPEEFGKATDAIESIMFAEAMAPPGDPDNLAKSDNKTAVANAAFYNANKDRCEAVYGTFAVLGLLE